MIALWGCQAGHHQHVAVHDVLPSDVGVHQLPQRQGHLLRVRDDVSTRHQVSWSDLCAAALCYNACEETVWVCLVGGMTVVSVSIFLLSVEDERCLLVSGTTTASVT